MVDWDAEFLSRAAKKWQPSQIRGLFHHEQRPGMISMLAGKPNPDTFPFESFAITLKPYPGGPTEPEALELSGDELSDSLQYGATSGLPGLVSWVTQLQQRTHSRGMPEEEGWRCAIGAGSQELMDKAFAAVCDPEDSILVESPAYSGTLGFLQPSGRKLVEIRGDEYGMSATELERVLQCWHTDGATRGCKFPKVVYTIPTGSNPAGSSASMERKTLILRLVRKYDLLLFEDDAYYFLHFDPPKRAPSYFALEKFDGGETGRVVRFDSLSKVISSGLRVGFITAPSRLIEVIELHTSNTNLQPSSLSQSIVQKLFAHWGFEGFEEHCKRVAGFYEQKLRLAETAAKKHLHGIVEWHTPSAGMFLWLNLLIAPKGHEAEGDSAPLIGTTAVERGLLAVPGFAFLANGGRSSHVRVSYSLLDEASADEGFRRLASLVLEARHKNGVV